MRSIRKYLIIVIPTLILLGISALFVSGRKSGTDMNVQLLLQDGTGIKPWYDEKDKTYNFFLPSYADTENVRLSQSSGGEMLFGGNPVKNGGNIGEYSLGETYTLSDVNGSFENKVRILKSGNISTVYVSTATGSLDYVYRSTKNKELAKVTVVDADGNVSFSSTDSKIKGRGNSTWTDYDKKPFSIILNKPGSILGMEQSSRWVLLANAHDRSGIRNALVFDTARNVGMANVPEYRFVDLYLNGEYNGVYTLCQPYGTFYERNGRGEKDLYLFTAELPERRYEANYAIPGEGGEAVIDVTIPEKLKEDDKEYAESLIRELDKAITSLSDEVGSLIDLKSWAQKYLIDEIFENYDAGLSSSYFYKYANGTDPKVYAGPIWDYDNVLGNTSNTRNPRILYADQKYRTKTERLLWYHELNQNPVFYSSMVDEFEKEFIPQIEMLISEGIKSLSDQIKAAKANDDIRWGTDSGPECSYMIGYLTERLDFLKSIWLKGDRYGVVSYYSGGETQDFETVYIPEGSALSEYPEYMQKFEGSSKWYIDGTSEEYDFSRPVTGSVVLSGKAKTGGSTLKRIVSEIKVEKKAVLILFSVVFLWMLPIIFLLGKRLFKGVT